MYYLLRKWQKKLGIGVLKSLDDLVNKYDAHFKANHKLEAAEEYVEQREFIDELFNKQSSVRDILTSSVESDADEICNDSMPDYTKATAQPTYVIPIYIDPTKPVS